MDAGINLFEFRKGNIVCDVVSGEWMIVDDINNHIGAILIDRNKYPLPNGWYMGYVELSMDVLKRCGFEDLAGNGMGVRLTLNGSDEFFFGQQDKELRYQTRGSGFTRDFGIKYLHQLQNLYYLFTNGKELEIK